MSEEDVPRRLRRFQREQQPTAPTQSVSRQPRNETRTTRAKESILQNLKRQLFRQGGGSQTQDIQKHAQVAAMQQVQKFKEKEGRLPEGNELDEIADNLFDQVRKNTEELQEPQPKKTIQPTQKTGPAANPPAHGRFRRTQQPSANIPLPSEPLSNARNRRIADQPAAPQPPQPAPTTSVQELFGSSEPKKKPVEKKPESDDFDLGALTESLGGTEDLEKEMGSLEKEMEGIHQGMETEKNKCPTCSTRTEDLAICPKCASIFCSHCAKTAKNLGNAIEYACPKCGKSFRAKKKT